MDNSPTPCLHIFTDKIEDYNGVFLSTELAYRLVLPRDLPPSGRVLSSIYRQSRAGSFVAIFAGYDTIR